MYEAFFRMQERPFAATPSPQWFVPAKAAEQARQSLARGIERAAGVGLIVGAAGTGKSPLLQVLAQQFAGQFDVALLSGGRLRTVRALLQNILFEMKLRYRDLSEGDLRLALLDRLEPSDRSSNGLLLLVDEAHALPARLLDELRMITNLVRGGAPRVRLVLAGDMRIEERLANPRLASFLQRVSARCYLQPLTREETFHYVRTQLTTAGVAAAELLDDEALAAVHRMSDGVPRLINQLCDHALILAAVAGERRITAAHMEEAWADLQQLPAPQSGESSSSVAAEQAAVVEFGALDELPSAPSTTRFDAPVQRAASRDPLAQLAAIQRHVTAASGDTLEDFEPLGRLQPEVELVFSPAALPFGGAFDEEEVVIDRYASLEARTLRSRPHVSSPEGRDIAALMGTNVTARRQLGIVADDGHLDSLRTGDESDEAREEPFDPASDPVLPEYYPHVSENESQAWIAAQQPELVVVDAAGDPQHARPSAPGRAQRQEYRQLFARLRRGG